MTTSRRQTPGSGSRHEAAVPIGPQHLRMWLTVVIFAGLVVLIVMRLHQLQCEHGPAFASKAETQRSRSWTIEAARGSILAADGTPLASSVPRFSLFADTDYMDDKLGATILLSEVLGIPRRDLRRHFSSGSNGRLIARDIDDEQAARIRKARQSGLHLRRSYQRVYPKQPIAPHVLGFVLNDGHGGAGLEQEFDQLLCGSSGRERFHVDVLSRPIIDGSQETLPAYPGAHVHSTLVPAIQACAEAQLAAAIERHRASSGVVVVMRPRTGEVLAMASWPSFDVLNFSDADPDHYGNRALNFVYESGSTMKPLVAGAAVSDGLARWDEKIFCENGRWRHLGRTLHDHSFRHGGHQWLSCIDIVAKSDNIGMAKLGIRLGPQRLYTWIRTIGFGQRTGIELPGEDIGQVHPVSAWNERGACMSVPMGHEMSVTPMQMLAAHAAVANDGMWMPPRLVKRVYSVDHRSGNQIQRPVARSHEPRRIFASEDARAIRRAMVATMDHGTGTRVRPAGWSSAGKTGTTEKLIGGQYADNRHIGSFVCFAPADPGQTCEVAIIAVIDDPRREGHYGSQTAGPVVQAVMECALGELGVPQDRGGM